jgi:hypothetical protein
MLRWIAVAALVVVTSLLPAGCLSGPGDASPAEYGGPPNTGGFAFSVIWPEATAKLIPSASQSLELVIADKSTGEELATRILTRTNPTTTVDGLLSGVIATIGATAYPDEGGAGTPLATAVVEAVVPVETRQSIALTLASTIASVTLVPDPIALQVGDSADITATARDAGGNVVPLGQPWEWASSDVSVATVTSTGVVSGVASGTISITAKDPESEQTGSVEVTVTDDGGAITTVAMTLGVVSLVAGGNTTATAAVKVDGADAAGVSVAFTSSDPAVATVSAATDTTDAAGQAEVTVNAVGAGPVVITATANAVSDTANLTVTATPVSRVAFWNATDLQFQIVDNEAGATPVNLDLGGVYFLFGAQRHGHLVFVTQAGYVNPQIRDLATGASTDFEPTNFSMWAGGIGFKLADISSDGQSVVWIRLTGGNRQIVRADVDGSNEVVLVSSAVPALMPARVAISPDGTEVGYITSTGTVRRISTAGGASVFLNLNGSTGAVSIDWRDDDNLVVGCANALGTGSQGIITVPRDVSPASILFNDGGTGLRSVPASVAIDPDGNILFDEVDAGLSQREIYRVDPPGLAARIGIVTRSQNDAGVWSLVY